MCVCVGEIFEVCERFHYRQALQLAGLLLGLVLLLANTATTAERVFQTQKFSSPTLAKSLLVWKMVVHRAALAWGVVRVTCVLTVWQQCALTKTG